MRKPEQPSGQAERSARSEPPPAQSAQEKDTALGAQLIADDKWLSFNILRADEWANGSAAELLDGSAWLRFCERLARLDDRVRSALAASDEQNRADGYRYLCMLIRNAFDVAIEDTDPLRPRIKWASRRNKYGWDCPDALYATLVIDPAATYRLRGQRSNVHFLGLQVAAGIRTLHNTYADDWDIAPDGSFELTVGGPERPRNWVPLAADARWIFIRQFFYDWEREAPATLWVDCIDTGGGGSEPSGLLDPAFFARRLDAVATHVEASVDLWLGVVVALRERHLNAFPPDTFGGTAMGAMAHQAAGTCYYRIAEDEALLLEVQVPRAKYWSVDVCNFWLESLDYANHQTSLNGHQAMIDGDGVFRAVLAHRDPGIANWLDTVGHAQGSLIYRWNLADALPVPELRVVPARDVRLHLPPDTRTVTPAERRRVIETRREGVRRRFARPG